MEAKHGLCNVIRVGQKDNKSDNEIRLEVVDCHQVSRCDTSRALITRLDLDSIKQHQGDTAWWTQANQFAYPSHKICAFLQPFSVYFKIIIFSIWIL